MVWEKISWLRPCESGANLSGPTLPRAMLRFWFVRAVAIHAYWLKGTFMWLWGKGWVTLEWNILLLVDSIICTLKKNSNPLRLHSRALMALDHSSLRLGLENKFLENKSGRIFRVRQVYFTKSCHQIWECTKPIFYTFYTSPLRWNSTIVFIIRTSDRMQYFTIFQDKLQSVNIQGDQSIVFI